MASVGKQLLAKLTARPVRRAFSTTQAVRSHSWQQHGVVGSNIPFRIDNRYRLALVFVLFFGSAFNLPFWVVRHQLTKK